jgi:hypothetical protein
MKAIQTTNGGVSAARSAIMTRSSRPNSSVLHSFPYCTVLTVLADAVLTVLKSLASYRVLLTARPSAVLTASLEIHPVTADRLLTPPDRRGGERSAMRGHRNTALPDQPVHRVACHTGRNGTDHICQPGVCHIYQHGKRPTGPAKPSGTPGRRPS